jgi:mono/diheme cytochrome c family protein
VSRLRPSSGLLAGVALLGLSAGCRQDMHDQPRYKPYAQSSFFGDDRSERPLVPGTVARSMLRDDPVFYTGKRDGAFVSELPFPVDAAVLARGQQRFRIYCTPCHGQTGEGNGMVVQRGYRQPPSYHIDRLRGEPVGYFYDVMTRGFGVMPDYAAQIEPKDRWAIAAYVKALQLSQYAELKELPDDLVRSLEKSPAPAPEEGQR